MRVPARSRIARACCSPGVEGLQFRTLDKLDLVNRSFAGRLERWWIHGRGTGGGRGTGEARATGGRRPGASGPLRKLPEAFRESHGPGIILIVSTIQVFRHARAALSRGSFRPVSLPPGTPDGHTHPLAAVISAG